MNNVVKNSKTSPKKSVTAKQLAKSNLTKRKNPDWDNLDKGYRYLTLDMKLPHDLAVAVMGNVVEESRGDYKAVLKNGGRRGLIQWDGKNVPSGRYSLWGSIWASVAKPANVYDSTTDTVKNYWAPWGGLKGDKVRLRFIKAPIKEKARIYAESYIRSGKNSRIADRQLSAMQLDSIYNPRIKDIIVLKNGGQIRKMLTAAGGPLNLSPEDIKRGANLVGEYFLKGLGAFGKIATAPFRSQGPTSATIYKSKKLLAKERTIENKSEELLGKAMTWVSPFNYGAALVTGNGLNAKKGGEEIEKLEPWQQALLRGTELYVGPKAVKGVKATPKAVVNTAAKAGVKPAKAAVVAREIKLATKNKPNLSNRTVSSERSVNGITGVPEVQYILYNEFGEPIGLTNIGGATLGHINRVSKTSNRMVDGIYSKNKAHKVSEDTYNVAVEDILNNGGVGLESGWSLMSPEKTMATTSKFPYLVIGHEFGNPVRLLTGTTKRPIPQRVQGNHYIEIKPKTTIEFDESSGEFKEVPIKENIQEPSTSLKFFERKPAKISEAERAGVPKGERNFKSKLHVANYPGYLLKGLMKGSLLEKQLSKNGTININLLNAYFNKASQIEKEIANKVLSEKFAGLKTIDYNKFKKAVLDELITYSTKPQTRYSTYGMNRLGFNVIKEPNGAGGIIEYLPGVKTNTFSFESPRILRGSDKHYDFGTLGHSRTYTTPDEPLVLHVMESLSDWAQEGIAKTNEAYRQKLISNPESYNKRINSLLRMNEELEDWENMVRTGINHGGIKLQPYEIQQIQQEFIPNLRKNILNLKSQLEGNPQALHLSNNYLQRQLQENLKFAAENGLTKMRYPTSETAAKIEGYLKKPKWFNLEGEEVILTNDSYDPVTLEIKPLYKETFGNFTHSSPEYTPQHQTILKKYADFPKLFLKLFKDLQVRTAIDAKGNTWYEVDVPKGYLSREWLFKQGGKMNILEFLKNGSGIHIKEKNKGKFTSYCGGKVTNECILKGKNSSNPAIRKRATFAANARKWKHEDGGELIKKAQLGTQLPKAEDAAQRYKNGEFIKEFLNNNEGHAVILGVRTNKPFHNQGSIVRKINYRMGIPVDTTYIETPPSLLPVKKISRKATRYSNLKDNAYVGNLRQLYETLSNRYKTAMEVMRRKNGGILKAQYGTPLNLSSEDVLGGLRFLNKGLNKVLGVLNTPVAGSAPTQATLPNGLLIEIPGILGGAPEYLPGRLGRIPQLKNRAWLEKSNPIVDEGSLQAAKDWVQMLKELRGRIVKGGRPKGSKNIVKPKETPVEPPVQKIETSYAQSGTSRERFLENRRMGISKRGRVSSNDRNARAMEAKGDARITNAGNYNLKKAQLQQVERNLNKYPKHEVEKFKNKTLLNMYRKGRSEADIQKATKEFYKYLANTYGYFKEGGILKAQLGTELTLYKDSENPNAVGGDIVNSYLRNQLMIPYINKQKEDYEKWKLYMKQQSNTLKSSLLDNIINTGVSFGVDYLKNKYGI